MHQTLQIDHTAILEGLKLCGDLTADRLGQRLKEVIAGWGGQLLLQLLSLLTHFFLLFLELMIN